MYARKYLLNIFVLSEIGKCTFTNKEKIGIVAGIGSFVFCLKGLQFSTVSMVFAFGVKKDWYFIGRWDDLPCFVSYTVKVFFCFLFFVFLFFFFCCSLFAPKIWRICTNMDGKRLGAPVGHCSLGKYQGLHSQFQFGTFEGKPRRHVAEEKANCLMYAF